MTSFFNKGARSRSTPISTRNQPAAPAIGRRHEHAWGASHAKRNATTCAIRDIGRLAQTFLGRSPDPAPANELRRFQIEQQNDGVPVPTMNSIVSPLRFLFTQTPSTARTWQPVRTWRTHPAGASSEPACVAVPRRSCSLRALGSDDQLPGDQAPRLELDQTYCAEIDQVLLVVSRSRR
jgi:hypothetical protein